MIDLTPEQRKWLADHEPVKVGITPEWGPYSFFTVDGKPAGIDVDVLNLISQRTGLKFEIIPAAPWEKMYQMAKERKLDVTTSTVLTTDREKVFTFTRPYGESSTVIVAREGDHRFTYLLQLRFARMAQPAKHLVTVRVQERLPQASMILLETQKECFDYVLDEKADVTVADMYTAAQFFNDHPRAKLGIAGTIPEFEFPLRLAVRRDYPILRDILDKGLASISREEMDQIVSDHLSFNLEGTRRLKLLEKRIIWVSVVAALISAALYIWNHFIRREIRARRLAQAELMETNKSLEVFAHAISHDLKAPLRAIRGLSEALREDFEPKLGDEGRDYIQRILGSVARMDDLITDVLAYTRASRATLSIEPVRLKKLVLELMDEFPAEQRNYFHLISELPDVRANQGMLGQCIANLLSNAVKFVPGDRTPNIRIWSERQGAMINLFVEDNGIGIAPADQERIFQLFQRVSPPGYVGTGVGLAVVAKGVARMHGLVGVMSRLGEGSKFWIRLPAWDTGSANLPA